MTSDRAVAHAALAPLMALLGFLAALALSLVLVHAAWAQTLPPEKWLPHRYIGTVTASDVHDGDTFTAEIQNDFGVTVYGRIRLAGIDAPEIFGPDGRRGVAARAYLAGLLMGQPVYLEVLVTSTGKPVRSFDRTVARAWIERDGQLQDVAGLMIQAGQGVAIPREKMP